MYKIDRRPKPQEIPSLKNISFKEQIELLGDIVQDINFRLHNGEYQNEFSNLVESLKIKDMFRDFDIVRQELNSIHRIFDNSRFAGGVPERIKNYYVLEDIFDQKKQQIQDEVLQIKKKENLEFELPVDWMDYMNESGPSQDSIHKIWAAACLENGNQVPDRYPRQTRKGTKSALVQRYIINGKVDIVVDYRLCSPMPTPEVMIDICLDSSPTRTKFFIDRSNRREIENDREVMQSRIVTKVMELGLIMRTHFENYDDFFKFVTNEFKLSKERVSENTEYGYVFSRAMQFIWETLKG